jgi:hypothetical protein
MTAHQQAALDFIRSRLLSGAIAPSLQEVADRLGFRGPCPRSQAKRVVDALVAAGDLVRTPHKVRALALPAAGGGALPPLRRRAGRRRARHDRADRIGPGLSRLGRGRG